MIKQSCLFAVLCITAVAADRSQAAIEITPAAFSGSETIVTFEGLAASGQSSITTVEGVTFSTVDNAAELGTQFDFSPGRTGPFGFASLYNFIPNNGPPFSDITIDLPVLANRVGMDLRTNGFDATVDFSLSLLSSGVVVDSIQIAGELGNEFEFYGFESTSGFDSILVDIPSVLNNALGLDNFRFEAIDLSSTIPEPTMFVVWAGLACCVPHAARRR